MDKEGKEILGDKYERPLNPRIRLDNGQIVWGMQCWWGEIDSHYEKMSAARKVTVVPVKSLRPSPDNLDTKGS